MIGYVEDALERVGLLGCEYGARITVFGFCGVRVEGHRGLAAYSEEKITVRLKGKCLFVTGKRLKIRELTRDDLFISGAIVGLETEREELRRV